MSEKKKNIPELRFPEFEGDGEWVEKKLGNCLTKKPEYGINAPAVPYSENLPTYLRITDISEDGAFLSKGKVSVDRNLSEDNYLTDGDIVLARTGASVGKSYKYRKKDGKLVFAGFLIRVKPNVKKLDSELLFQFLSTSQYWKWVSMVSARSGQPGINGTQYSSMPIALPPRLAEQQKIAACLSSLDRLIAAHRDKLQALNDHKKGLMQNLFPQEGEKAPKYRFPEFEGDGEWVEKKLGKIATFSSGGTPSKKVPEYWNGTIPWISASSMYDINIHESDLKITEYALESGAKMAKKGTILILVRGSMLFKRVPIGLTARDVSFNQDVKAITLKKDLVPEFILYHLIACEKMIPIDKTGIGAGKIELNELKSFILFIPKNRIEQQKIASCLSALDALIAAQAEKIEQLQQHKKGLMQGLFP